MKQSSGRAAFLWRFVDSIIYGAYLFDVQNGINVKQKISIKFTTQQAPGTTNRRTFNANVHFFLSLSHLCGVKTSCHYYFHSIECPAQYIRFNPFQSDGMLCSHVSSLQIEAHKAENIVVACVLFCASCASISSNLRVMIL